MFQRQHFFKKFDAEKTFISLKYFLTGGVDYSPGMPFDKSSIPPHKLQAMFNSRRITYSDLFNPAEIVEAAIDNPNGLIVVSLVPEIVMMEKGWLGVFVNGEKIGRATRDRQEAERIAREWLESPD